MIHAFFLALGQLFDGRVARVFLKSMALTLLLFAVLGVALWYGIHWATAYFLGAGAATSDIADIVTIVLVLVLHWLLFRAIAIGVIGVFGDEVVEAVEARHYPDAHARVRHVPFVRSARMGLGSAARTLLFNLIFSPVYIIANVAAPVVFFVVNSWLLGRDLGDMVAVRHMSERELPAWRRRTVFPRLMLGGVATALLFIPVVNLVAPVLGAAMAANAFHLRRHK